MKKLLATIFVAVLLYQTALSQVALIREPDVTASTALIISRSSFSISGIIQGEEGQGLPFASVLLLLAKDSTLVKGLVASKSGEYRVENVGAGNYLLLAAGAGYNKAFSAPFTLAPEGEGMQVETLILPAAAHQAGEITVDLKPFFQKEPDKLVVHVQKGLVTAGNTALDLLAGSPGITLNRHNSSLFLNGKDDILLMMNGKKSTLSGSALLQMLSSIKATDVERIELTTTPSDSYQAKDKEGVIDIVLKPNADYGTSGAFTLMAGYGAHEKAATNLQVTHRGKKLNWFGEYALLRDHSRQTFENYRQVDYQQVITRTRDVITRHPLMINHTAGIGMDYSLGSRTTVAGLLSGLSTRWKVEDEQIHSTVLQSNQVVNDVKIQHQEVNQLHHLMGNLAVQHRFTAQHEISFNVDHLYYHVSNPNQFTITNQKLPQNSHNQEQFSINRQTPVRIWTGKADFAQQFNTHTRFEAGLKGSLVGLVKKERKESVQDGIQTLDTISSHQIALREAILASYVNFHQQINARTKLQVGLRFEFTRTQADAGGKDGILHRQYGTYLPHVLLSHDLQKGSSLQLSYERRLIRPTFNNLVPFLFLIDPSSGNLSLKPALKEALGVSYRFRENYLLTLNYSYEKNPIVFWQVYVAPETNQQHARAENLKHTQSYSLAFSLPIRVNAWWQMQYETMAAWQRNVTVYEGSFLQLPTVSGSISSTQRFALPHNLSAELAGFYQTRSPFGIAYLKAFGTLSFAVEKKLKNDSGILKITADDVLGTMGLALNTNQPALSWNHSFKGRFTEPCILKLTYVVTIGNKHIKAIKGRTSGSEEEQKRVNK